MKKTLILILSATFATGLVLADDKRERRKPTGERRGPLQEMIKKFDKDGDGKLNEEERQAARKAFVARRGAAGGRPFLGEILKRFDKDGDGKLSDEERAAARAEGQKRRAELMKKFDKDGDSKLSPEERKAMGEEIRKRREAAAKEGRRPPGENGERVDAPRKRSASEVPAPAKHGKSEKKDCKKESSQKPPCKKKEGKKK